MDGQLQPKYRPDIDGLRGVAVLLVVLFHGFPYAVPSGFVGVDVFFVISGFLISSIIFKGLEQGRFSFLDFYVRRIRRIYPALILVLGSSLLFGWFRLFPEEYELLGRHAASGAGFVANALSWLEAGYFDSRQDLKPLLHLWSLGVEEQYYLVWPALLALLWKWPRALPVLLVSLLLSSFAANVLLVVPQPNSTFYLLHTRFWELLLGSALAYVWLLRERRTSAGAGGPGNAWVAESAAFVGIVLLGCAVAFIDKHKHFPGWWALLPCVGSLLLIAAGPRTFINRRFLSSRPLVFVGLISYPLYLWHWPLMAFARVASPSEPSRAIKATLICASFVLAWLTYRYIERPIRASRSPWTAGVLFAISLAIGAFGLTTYLQDGYPGRTSNASNGRGATIVADTARRNRQLLQSQHWDDCDDVVMNPTARDFCAVAGPRDGIPVVLWGDSHAQAWSSVFFKIATERGLRLYLIYAGGCPPIVEMRRADAIAMELDHCTTFGTAEDVIAALKSIRPHRIFVVAHWGAYHHSATTAIRGEAENLSTEQRGRAVGERLVRTLTAVADIAPTTVFRSMPKLLNDAPRALARNFPLEPTVEAHRAYEAAMDRAIDAAAARSKDMRIFDPATIVCRERCTAVMQGTLLYRDQGHLSRAGAMVFEDVLLERCFGFLSALQASGANDTAIENRTDSPTSR